MSDEATGGTFTNDGDYIYMITGDNGDRAVVAHAVLPGMAYTLAHAANVGLDTMGQHIADRMIAGLLPDDPL